MSRQWRELHEITRASFTEFPFLTLWITLPCMHVQHACYCILYFLARYSNLYVIYSYFPLWLLLNPPFPVCFMLILNCQNHRNKIPACLLECFFHKFIWYTFPKKLYLDLFLSSMSLYRHNLKKI